MQEDHNRFRAQEIVREFTEGAADALYENQTESHETMSYPDRPTIAEPEKVVFISKMVMSELLEMLLTTSPSVDIVKETLHRLVDNLDLPTTKIPSLEGSELPDDEEIIEAQVDAVADVIYYLLDFSTKQGYRIDRILDLVHQANMAKKHADNRFHKRADGKVLKPAGWKEADLRSEIRKQMFPFDKSNS